MITFEKHDGGRADAGFRGTTRDCVPRAIAIATGLPYREIYDELSRRQKAYYTKKLRESTPRYRRFWERRLKQYSARNGVRNEVWRPYLKSLGWQPSVGYRWIEDFPSTGTFIILQHKHMVTIKDGVLYDTYDSSKTRSPRSRKVRTHYIPV